MQHPKLNSDTCKMVEALVLMSTQLDQNVDTWRELLELANEDLTDHVRESIEAKTGVGQGLDSVAFQLKAIELNVRIQILEEFVGLLPNK